MKVKFLPSNEEHEIRSGQSVMNLAHENGIHIQSVCKGIPSCAECRVRVVEGAMNVLPPFAEEIDLIGTAHFVDQRRLSCQLRCFGDLTVDLTEQIEKESVSTMQPKGRFKKEDGESVARLGNILEEESSIELEISEEEAKDVLKDAPLKILKAKTETEKEALNRGEKKKKSKPRPRNNSKKKQQAQASASNEGEAGVKKKSKNKNRNRNRNRNRKNSNSNNSTSEKKAD